MTVSYNRRRVQGYRLVRGYVAPTSTISGQ